MVAKKTIHADETVCPKWAPIAQPIHQHGDGIDDDGKRIAKTYSDSHKENSFLFGTRRIWPPSEGVRQPKVIVSVC
jgi:hypothetical protein